MVIDIFVTLLDLSNFKYLSILKYMSCVFCDINKDKIILDNEDWYVIYDEYPVSKGHLLIIPKNI